MNKGKINTEQEDNDGDDGEAEVGEQ